MTGATPTSGLTVRGRSATKTAGLTSGWCPPSLLPQSRRPRPALTLTAALGLSRYERMGQSGRSISVATEHMTFHLRLPAEKKDLGFDAVLTDAGHHGMEYVGLAPVARQRGGGTARLRLLQSADLLRGRKSRAGGRDRTQTMSVPPTGMSMAAKPLPAPAICGGQSRIAGKRTRCAAWAASRPDPESVGLTRARSPSRG